MKNIKLATKAFRGLSIALFGLLPNYIFAAGAVDIADYNDSEDTAKEALETLTITELSDAGKSITYTDTSGNVVNIIFSTTNDNNSSVSVDSNGTTTTTVTLNKDVSSGYALSEIEGIENIDEYTGHYITKYIISTDDDGDVTYEPVYYSVNIDTYGDSNSQTLYNTYYWQADGTISTNPTANEAFKVYYTNNSTGLLTGDSYSGNYVGKSKTNLNSSYSGGAAISNTTTISSIAGDFIGNYITANESCRYTGGGAIYNSGTISSIAGNFIGNYSSVVGDDSGGGAIYNYNGTITSIIGDFIGNYVDSGSTEGIDGGAIFNYDGTISSIIGNFIGNSATNKGGAICNTGTISSIIGDFIGNSSSSSSGGAISNDGTISSIIGDFIGNSSNSNGGAICNYGGTITSIIGDFIDNSSSSNGGAISNDGTISSITGDFIGNSASSSGGAIYISSSSESAAITLVADAGNDYYYIGNYVTTAVSSDYDVNGGFLYINSGTVEFATAEGASITIGTGEAGFDSIASSASSTTSINKTGTGTLTINSSMAYYYGSVAVEAGTLELSSYMNSASSISVAENGTLCIILSSNNVGETILGSLSGEGEVYISLDLDSLASITGDLTDDNYITSIYYSSDFDGTIAWDESLSENINEEDNSVTITIGETEYTLSINSDGTITFDTGDAGSAIINNLGRYLMDNYSQIAEVNTMLLSNQNIANVNRARSILEKSAGVQIGDKDGTVSVVDASEVSLIKYSNVAQLQLISMMGNKNASNGVGGYEYYSVGSTANFDEILSENALVGVSVGGTYNKVTGDAGESANSTTFLLNAYAVYANEGLELFGNIGYAHFWNEGYNSGSKADWDSDAFNALIGISYDLETSVDGLTITPLAMLNMVLQDSESASYSNGVDVNSESYFSAKLMLGFEFEYAINSQFNAIVRTMYMHEMGDDTYDFTYGVGSLAGLNYQGSSAGKDSALIGLGLSYDFSETCTAYFDYNAYAYSELITHSLNLSVALKF